MAQERSLAEQERIPAAGATHFAAGTVNACTLRHIKLLVPGCFTGPSKGSYTEMSLNKMCGSLRSLRFFHGLATGKRNAQQQQRSGGRRWEGERERRGRREKRNAGKRAEPQIRQHLDLQAQPHHEAGDCAYSHPFYASQPGLDTELATIVRTVQTTFCRPWPLGPS